MTIDPRCAALGSTRRFDAAAGEGAPSLAGVWYRLEELVDWERTDRARMRVDLSPEIDLMTRLGDPHRMFRSVHVAGTKGKGSVCALIEAGLLNAGLRAGRYASPHIEHVTERVSHLGQAISDSAFAAALSRALDARDAAAREGSPARDATWFDVITAAAFLSFAHAGLEWVVVEVGLGGLLDSTNVVMADLAVVTNVELEHTEILGKTVEEIATQKAGIIKQGRPVLTPIPASHAAGHVVRQTARALASELTWVDLSRTTGLHACNVALARAALDRLGEVGAQSFARRAPLGKEDLPEVVAGAARLPGRMEAVVVDSSTEASGPGRGRPSRVILDGAHVGFAISAVIVELRRDSAWMGGLVVLLALAADKNADDFIDRLSEVASYVVCTQIPGGRSSWPADELARICETHGLACERHGDPWKGFEFCLDVASDDAWVLVTGSLHLVGSVRSRLQSLVRVPTR